MAHRSVSPNRRLCQTCHNKYDLLDFPKAKSCRLGRSHKCAPCTKAYARKVYLANRQVVIQRSKEWAAKNAAKVREIKRRSNEKLRASTAEVRRAQERARRQKHIETVREKGRLHARRFRSRNPLAMSLINKRARAKSIARDPDRWRLRARQDASKRRVMLLKNGSAAGVDYAAIAKRDRNKCRWCGKKVGKKRHFDHVIPVFGGGDHKAENIVLSCPPCNMSKGVKVLTLF